MSDALKVFTYETEGLSYEVRVYCDDEGNFFAEVTVLSGAMDVNALYLADDDHADDSEGLSGPLNMNGAGSEYDGTEVQWDEAIKLSDPGLGPEGEDKDTYLSDGETSQPIPLEIDCLDDIAYVGVRATSTTTDEGSIKGVSGEPEDPLYEKVFFYEVAENGDEIGSFIRDEEPDPNTFDVPSLPEGTEPTFENYVTHFEDELGGDVTAIDGVAFYASDEEGNPIELFRIEAPDGGFADAEDLLDAYDAALESMAEANGSETEADLAGADLMAALSIDVADEEDDLPATEPEDCDEPELELI